jgi:hypothetical protein
MGLGSHQHPLVGCSVPDFEFVDGSGRMSDRLHSGRGALVHLWDDEAHLEVSALARRWGSWVDHVVGHARDELGLRALLVRPDGFVAWAAADKGDLDLTAAEAALERWFGPDAHGRSQVRRLSANVHGRLYNRGGFSLDSRPRGTRKRLGTNRSWRAPAAFVIVTPEREVYQNIAFTSSTSLKTLCQQLTPQS